MSNNMKSVMIFDPKDTDEQTANRWINWIRHNKSAVGDKAVPNAEDTRKLLSTRYPKGFTTEDSLKRVDQND